MFPGSLFEDLVLVVWSFGIEGTVAENMAQLAAGHFNLAIAL